MKIKLAVGVAMASGVLGLWAETQVWNDSGADNLWSTNAANWADSTVWTNGNAALFTGNNGTSLGETVDVDGDIIFSGMRFLTNGYTIADANNNGTFTLTNQPNIETVSTAGTTIISESLAGTGGFNKTGAGLLQLTASNTYSGVTTVKAGTLRLSDNVPTALGATGTGNGTVVEDGATLDTYSAYKSSVNEDITIIGSGVNGAGAFVNNGPTPYYNVGYRNLTLAGNAVIGGSQRFDMSGNGAYYGNGCTLTKTGSCEVAVGRPVTNSPIIINAGTYTIQHNEALGGSDYPTTINNGKLMTWGNYTITERIFANGGTLAANGTGVNTFKIAGNVTLGGNLTVQTETSNTNTIELAGVLDGSGGFTRNGGGFAYVTNNANTYSGPTIVNSGSRLWVGRTIGGTGILGTGVTTNNGTLFANSPVLSSGTVVNNNSGTLVLAPPTLTVGRIVNQSGTVYGTSVVQTVNGVVNASTWQAYSGDFGSSVVTNANGGTMNLYTNQLIYGAFVNGGRLNFWQPINIMTSMTFNGGSVYVSDVASNLTWSGAITTETLATFDGTNGSNTEISGVISGSGGIACTGGGGCTILADNTYAGPTIVNGGKTLWVGKPNVMTGRLGSGAVTNNGWLYFDHPGAYEIANGLNGGGLLYVRYGAAVTVNGCGATNSIVRLAQGSLSLVNGAYFAVPGEMVISDRLNVNYTSTPTNVQFVMNVATGCTLVAANITFGNGMDLPNGSITGILNQIGGVVRTTSAAAEENGVRLGHYPQARSFYNMMGGTLVVEGNWDLGCATDGQGWFNMTGGEVFAKRVMLNEREGSGGYGRLTVAGGTLNVGSLTGSTLAISNAICADKDAPYLVELGGGANPTIRAVTNLWIPVKATLSGSGASAITFDAQQWTIALTNQLSGSGGLNTMGTGTVVLAGNNTFTGLTQVAQGTLQLARAGALAAVPLSVASNAVIDLGGFGVAAKSLTGAGLVTNGGLTVSGTISPAGTAMGTLTVALTNSVVGGALVVDADANGDCDQLYVKGSLDLYNMSLQVVEHGTLDVLKRYTIVQCEGTLSGVFSQKSLPSPWFVYCDYAAKKVILSAQVGTVIRLH